MSACHLKPDTVPFPANETGFEKPVAKKLAFTPDIPFQYTTISPDSVRPPQSVAFDLDQLPSKPFRVNNFKPLKEPLRQTPFNLAGIPDSAFNLEATTAEPFRLQQFILPKPAKVKAGVPKLMPGTTTGVLQFSTEEGLPGINISASLADQYGNTWLATEKGLCRYNGEYLYIYSFLNKNAIGGDYTITGMAEDKQGNFWIVTGGDGIYIINITANIVQRYVSNTLYSSVTIDHEGIIWAGSYLSGLFVIDPVKNNIKNIRYTNTTSNENSIITIKEDRYNNIWLGYFDHAAIVDSTRKHIRNITTDNGLVNSLILKFLEDSNGDMWVSMYGGGINVLSVKNKTMGTLSPKNGFTGTAVELAEDNQHQIWMMRKDTCYILNRDRTAIKEILLDIKMLEQNGRGSCLMDRSGNIWLGTLGKGVVIIDTKGPLPEHFTTAQGLSDNNIWGITEDNLGNIWLGTRQYVNVYDPRKDQLKIIGKQQGLGGDRTGRVTKGDNGNIFISTSGGLSMVDVQRKMLTNFSDRNSLLTGFSKCLADTTGNLWVSSTGNGVVWYDTKNNTVKTITKKNGLLSDVNWDMIKDRQGNLWAGSDSGITVINPNNNTLKYLREKDGLCNNVVYKLLLHPSGEIWVGTLKGISIINTQNFTITNLTPRQGLVPQDIYDMVEHQGTIYAGSSDGLIAIKSPGSAGGEKQSWRLTRYGKREGFPYNDYNQNTGYVTKGGQSWWGVAPMLTVVTQQPLEDSILPQVNITGVNIMDEPLSFSYWASMEKYVKAGDTLWNETRTNFYLKNTLPKDAGYLKDHNIHWDSITPGFRLPMGLTLPYDQNSVNFSFINNDIKGREKIMYRYILEGADTTWSDVSDKSTTRNYFNLSPGRYTFKVSSKGFNGLWSKVQTYSFTILPPWWKTWWAYMLYAVMAGVVVNAYGRYRSRKLIEKNAELENRISQRTSELSQSLEELKATQSQLIQSEKMASLGELTAGIAHEIQNPLNFVNNFSEVSNELIDEMKEELEKGNYEDAKQIAEDVQQNLEKINRHGKRADAIVKGMLQHSRSSSGQKELTDINALCDEYIRLSYHGLRAKDKSFNAKFETGFDNSVQKVNIVSQDIGRVILNLLNNAFYAVNERKKAFANQPAQNSYEPTVVIATKKMTDNITISVKDNGNGIPQSAIDKIFQPFFTTKPTGQGTGLGLSLSYDIVKAHGGELKVETKEGEGTTFIITLPS